MLAIVENQNLKTTQTKHIMISKTFKALSVCLALTVLLAARNVSADLVYDNSVNDIGTRFDPGLNEVGDEILIDGPGRYLTSFAFGYWALNNGLDTNPFSGTPEVRVRFYLNDGPDFNGYATPSSIFYESTWFALPSPTTRDSLVYSIGSGDLPAGGLFLPVVSNFTWTVQFRGLGAGDAAGLDIFDPPITGFSYPDYWENVSGSWTLKTNVVNMNFAARFDAVVPEPSGVVLAILGGLGLMLAGRRFRKV